MVMREGCCQTTGRFRDIIQMTDHGFRRIIRQISEQLSKLEIAGTTDLPEKMILGKHYLS